MKKRIIKWVASSLALLAMTITLASCGSKGFDQRVVIPEAKWDVENHVPIDVTVNDTLGIYVFGLGLRHMENYRYSNLFVFLHTTMPNGNVTHDTIQCILATPLEFHIYHF